MAWLGAGPVGIDFVHWVGPRDAELQQHWPGVPEIYRLWVKLANIFLARRPLVA